MLSINSVPVIPPAWSPDGNRIAFVGSAGIYTVRFDGTELVSEYRAMDRSARQSN